MINKNRFLISISCMFALTIMANFYSNVFAATLIVPGDYSTIQQAIDAANPGDIIQVQPGTYMENISIYKSVSLIALTYDPDDPTKNTTIIDSGTQNIVSTIVIPTDVSPMPVIRGFVIRNGDDGIEVRSEAVIEYNFFDHAIDQLDFEAGGGGIVRNNVFFSSQDDGIDLDDLDRPILIENNRIMYSGDDGIEIRLQDTSAPIETVTATIKNNQIIGCQEDGIQIIDYGQTIDTNRRFIITGNLIANCSDAGIGMMPDSNTSEDFTGADVIEPVYTYNNTFYGNEYGLSGGDNHVAFNNIFANSSIRAVWRVKGQPSDDSVVAYSLFFNNGVDAEESELGDGNVFGLDPLFAYPPNAGPDTIWYTVDDDFSGLYLLSGSPAIDAGISQYISNSGEAIPPSPITEYSGSSPDLGWKEFGYTPPPTLTPTITPTPSPTPFGFGIVTSQVSSTSDDAEEATNTGKMYLDSSDLEFGADGTTDQWVGMKFNNINIPQGAYIISAYIEFDVDETGSDPTSVTFYGQAADNAQTFSSTDYDITSRARTTAKVAWNDIPSWTTIHTTWQSPDLSSITQEIIDRPLWTSGNSLAIFLSGTGKRTAESFDGESPRAPKLVIEYTTGPTPTPAPPPTLTPTYTPSPTPTITLSPPPPGTIRFGVIGDYGSGSQYEEDVANLVKSWNPDFIVTTGDNNYPLGEASTIDQNIGQFYHAFIEPYLGTYGAGADINRFFPSLGNHDWETSDASPYLDYLTLPGNERYFDFVWGPVHFYVVSSDSREPDGRTSTSTQGLWLQSQLAASTSQWNIVYMHHAPYSSGLKHGSSETMQWPYQEWGADAVLAGHDHEYERLVVNGFPYFVNGSGGSSLYSFGEPLPGSEVRYNSDFGAMLVEASDAEITFKFISRTGLLIDTYTLLSSSPATPTPTDTPTSTPTDTPTPTPTDTPTSTPTDTPTSTPTDTPTNTPISTDTPTPTPTDTPTPTPTDTPTPTFTPTPTPGVNKTYANGETVVAGTVNGDYFQTHLDDGDAESIEERLSGGKPQFRYSYLEHKWTFTIPDGNNTTFYANVWQSNSGDNDQFTFSYSMDDSSYTDMFTIENIDDAGLMSYTFPPTTSGTIYVRVKDTNQTSGASSLDTIYIDYLFIESETQPGTPPLAPTDLTATVISGNLIELGWVDNADDELGFYIYRSLDSTTWTMIDTADANTVTYLDSSVFPDTMYTYRLQAYNGSGVSSYSNTATVSTPIGLVLTGSSYKEKAQYLVNLSWQGGTGPTYDIYRDNLLIIDNFSGTGYTDPVAGRGNYLYQVCEFGSTAECSNIILISFNVLK